MSQQRSVLITGANGGMGEALCALFQQRGWFVIATDLHPKPASVCQAYVAADLVRVSMEPPYRAGCLQRMHACLPDPGRLDLLINNAARQIVAPVERLTAADWHETMDVNVTAAFLLVQGFLRELEAAHGMVINIASVHAQLTKPQFTAYATSKAAVVGLTRALAVELGGRVRVNAVCPAAVATPMLVAGFEGNQEGLDQLAACHPSRCIGTPQDVAGLVFSLTEQSSHYITGAIINVDGGIGSRLFDPA
jgi:NAD(P)-dependent dehydrogenase (short-subunit alcohol dehydrogenase family)